MKFLNKLVLRKRVGSFYADHLPDEIRYRNRAGEEVSVPTEKATVDELAFALQLASEEQSIVSRRRSDRKSTRLNSSHVNPSRMPSSA